MTHAHYKSKRTQAEIIFGKPKPIKRKHSKEIMLSGEGHLYLFEKRFKKYQNEKTKVYNLNSIPVID